MERKTFLINSNNLIINWFGLFKYLVKEFFAFKLI